MLNGFLQIGRYAFVGIQAENPVVFGRFDGKLFLGSETQPGLIDDPGAVAHRQRLRVIGAAGVDHHDVVGKARAFQAVLQLGGGIERDDRNGKRLTRGWHL
ncbi:hypothetical protein SDC9_192670 [bioreactor metagenome]|uniref:Uncharacterized protein n=1 Tax=bioreactor metagenome TaxID=1076179 RepID=A0A645ICE7_9ZZZZ